jgi:hypothetical protein
MTLTQWFDVQNFLFFVTDGQNLADLLVICIHLYPSQYLLVRPEPYSL